MGAEGMGEAEQVSALIGDIYDASLDPALWPSVLERACRLTQSAAGAMMAYTSAPEGTALSVSWGAEEYADSYCTYNAINPLNIPTLLQRPGRLSRPRMSYPTRNSLKGSARHLYETVYCQRGQMENLIKLHGQMAGVNAGCNFSLALSWPLGMPVAIEAGEECRRTMCHAQNSRCYYHLDFPVH